MPNPLSRILDDNILTGPNFLNWKRNLMIVLTVDKVGYVLREKTHQLALANATPEQRVTFEKWHEADELAHCYMLASMSNILQKQCESIATAKEILGYLQKLFGEQSQSTC